MTYSRGDVLKLELRKIDPPEKTKERYGVVLTEREYNLTHDHGVVVAMSTTADGIYSVKDLAHAGLTHPTVVTAWLWTVPWQKVIRKTGELPPFELARMIDELRKVVSI